jgi:hypothetical protein
VNRYLAGTIVMSALLVVYLGFAVVYASILLQDDSLFVNTMGLAMLVLPILGAWGLFAEWRFGARSSALRAQLAQSNGLPEFETYLSGRFDKDKALEAFPKFQAAVEAAEDDWRAWFRLGLAYDACGDRRRARWAVRKAIALSRSDNH